MVPLKEYLRLRTAKIHARLSAVSLWILSLMVFAGIFVVPFFAFPEFSLPMKIIIAMSIFGTPIGLCAIIQAARDRTQEAAAMEDVELLTPKKAGKLPVEATLVRASSEPAQEQKEVLLRAASGSEETPPEQLLRPGS